MTDACVLKSTCTDAHQRSAAQVGILETGTSVEGTTTDAFELGVVEVDVAQIVAVGKGIAFNGMQAGGQLYGLYGSNTQQKV